MAGEQKTQLFLFTLASCLLLSNAARIKDKSQLGTEVGSITEIGPVGEPWEKGAQYACMQKWQSGGVVSSEGYVEKFCLVNLDTAFRVASAHLQFAQDISACQSSGDASVMKVCALKGTAPDGKLSYGTKAHVWKACFRFSTSAQAYQIIEAALDEKECVDAFTKRDPQGQGSIGEAIITTTTTTTITPKEEEPDVLDEVVGTVECDCEDGFVGEVNGRDCTCKPAFCEVIGTINKGPDCRCMDGLYGEVIWSGDVASGQCNAEMKDFFVDGEEKTWEYNGKSIKCCVSSAGSPTELQDMKAEELPAARSFGTKTGCGYMFGDTYHNWMKGGSCTASVIEILARTGMAFYELQSLLELEY